MPSPYSSSASTYVNKSGNTLIDSLLSNNAWGSSPRAAVNLTYSFPWSGGSNAWFAGYNGEAYSTNNEWTATEHYGLNNTQQNAASSALKAWGNVANISFTQVSETSSQVGDIRFAFSSASSLTSYWGYANYPNSYWPSAGDIWINAKYGAEADWSVGSYNYEALMHEVGHAIGLKHPFEDSPKLSENYDYRNYTLMSYTDPKNDLWQVNYTNICPETPMVLDIQAIQYLYGANYNYNSNDTIYTFDPSKPFFKTIWDGGGKDTISIANFIYDSFIDLTPGSYSSIKYKGEKYSPIDTEYYNGSNNLGIAYGCIIEDIIAGKGNDTLIGNSANNNLDGSFGNDSINAGSGDDIIIGGAGNDTIDGGPGTDIAVFSANKSNYKISFKDNIFSVIGPDGSDQVINVEYFQFLDQKILASSLVDTKPPIITALDPIDVAINVENTINLTITFNEEIKKGTGEIQIKIGSLFGPLFETINILSANITTFGNKLIINPIKDFSSATKYYVQIPIGAVQDLSDNNYQGIENYSFNTSIISLPINGTATADRLVGTSGNEKISALAGNDTIDGNGGNDTINAGPGNDLILFRFGSSQIDGEEGFDIINVAGPRLNYSIVGESKNVYKILVTESTEIWSINNIERLKFSNKDAIALDIDGNAGQAYRLYKAALDRTPDERGLAGWIKFMDDGGALTAMAQQFINSQEFSAKYGALDNTGFVNQLYKNVLARNGEASGVAGWVGGLNGGMSRADVLKGFSESSENQANVIGQIKNGISYTEWWLA